MSAADVGAVATLFSRTFGAGNKGSSVGLECAIGSLYLPNSGAPDLVSSLVSYDEEGILNGFIGVFTMPFTVDGKSCVAAFCGGHMVDPARADGLLGARLLRSVFKGSQDLTISDTANSISEAMWRRMKAHVLPGHSLEWVRIFRPGSFAANVIAKRVPRPFRAFSDQVLARPVDLIGGRLLPSLSVLEPSHCEEEEIGADDDFAKYLIQFTSHFAGRPDWPRMNLVEMVSKAKEKPAFGDVTRKVVLRAGSPIGLYHLHAKPSGVGRVLQIAAIPGSEQMVVDRLFLSAHSRGLAGLHGRTQPRLLDAMLTRRCQFYHRSSTLVHARDPDILAPFLQGDAFLNGFAGEGWTSFFGGGL